MKNDNDVICFVKNIKDKKITICHKNKLGDCKETKYKVNTNKDGVFIKLIKNERTYLVTDTPPKFQGNLCSLFTSEFREPSELFTHNPVVSIIFVINSKGDIVQKGFLRPDLKYFFNEYTNNVIEQIENTNAFLPALIDSVPVSSIYSIVISYSDLNCIEGGFSKNWKEKNYR